MRKVKSMLIMCLIAMLCSISYAGESTVIDANEVPVVYDLREPGIAVWSHMGNSFERIIGLRVGYETEFNVELGGSVLWQQEEETNATPDRYGAYLVYWIDEIVVVSDSDGYTGIEDLLHLLVAEPYALIEGLYDDPQDDFVLGLGGGTAFYVKEDTKRAIGLTVEYESISGYEEKLKIGLRVKF